MPQHDNPDEQNGLKEAYSKHKESQPATCDSTGCSEAPLYMGKDGEKLCQGCVSFEISTGSPDENFTLLSDIKEAINLDENPGPVTDQTIEIEATEVSIIPPLEDEEGMTVFIENLTGPKLEQIQTEINTLPVVTNKTTYDLTFSMHQVLKKFRQLLKKSVIQKIKDKKTTFESDKTKLNQDHETVLGVLLPMEKQLADARQEWDDSVKAKKDEAAKIQAENEEAEQLRQEKIKAEFDAYDAKEIREEKERLEAESERLERDKYEFACDKERAGYTAAQAEIETYRTEFVHPLDKNNVLYDAHKMNREFELKRLSVRADEAAANNYEDCLSQDELDAELKKIDPDFDSEAEEKALNDFSEDQSQEFNELSEDDHAAPAETVEILTADDLDKDYVNSVKNEDHSFKNRIDGDGFSSNIDEKLNQIDSDLEKVTGETGHDDQVIIDIKVVTDYFMNTIKSSAFNDPSKQKKLENFILNVEINFNTFKKGTEDGN